MNILVTRVAGYIGSTLVPLSLAEGNRIRVLDALYAVQFDRLGGGKSSERIASGLRRRIVEKDFARHKPERYHVPVDHCFRGDGLE